MKRLKQVIAFLALGFAVVQGHSYGLSGTNAAECCLLATSRAAAVINPPVGEDKGFFIGGVTGQPNLAMVFMRPKRMLQLMHTLYEIRTPGTIESTNNGAPAFVSAMTGTDAATGCENTFLNALTYFHPRPRNASGTSDPTLAGVYSAAKVYPPPESAYAAELAQTTASDTPNLFQPTKFYTFLDWSYRCDASDGTCKPWDTSLTACEKAGLVAGSAQHTACTTCLTTKGYWLNPSVEPWKNQASSGVFAGNWLNFYPPKFVIMRMAVKTVLKSSAADGMRIAAFTHEGSNGAMVMSGGSPSFTAHLHPGCGGTGAPNKDALGNLITNYPFEGNEANPIAEVVTNVGQYLTENGLWSSMFGNGSSSAVKTGGYIDYSNDGNSSRPHCTACTKHYILVFSDGRGDEANPYCVLEGGVPKPPCLKVNQCTVEGMGEDNDGGDWIKDDAAFGQATVTGSALRETPAGTCDRDYADDIARYLKDTSDMYRNGDKIPQIASGVVDGDRQYAYTYTVGVGSNVIGRQKILEAMAKEGGGKYFNGTNYAGMVDAIREIFGEINRRATSFSATTATQLQPISGSGAFVPRFRPETGRVWRGYMYRFGVFNEFVEEEDLNADGDMDDVFMVQRVDPPAVVQKTDIVGEDDDGNFILPYSSDDPATPWWEAGARLQAQGPSGRLIYTVLDRSASGTSDGRLDANDQLVEFTEDNASLLAPYLGLEGTTTCSGLATALALPVLSTDLTECAKKVIQFVRGVDIADEDGDDNRTEQRPWLLGDIFHSTPALLDVPAPKFLCDLGLTRQCARTVYAESLPVAATPLERYTVDGAQLDAYEKHRSDRKTRDRLVLVGANDGMLHAFHAGSAIDPEPVPTADEPLPDSHDMGTGDEVWAFIPPDLLPKLRLRMEGTQHHYFVDGDVMARDVWADRDTVGTVGKKEAEEFHTVVVISERRGGNHYSALEVTDPPSTTTSWYPNAPRPSFRWLFPQPCSDEAREVGETWMNVSPKPPPIGPVLVRRTADGTKYPVRHGVPTEERWAVLLQGGYDPNYSLGQSLYVLDVWSGNMLWKAAFNTSHARLQYMRYPIAAPIAGVDIGAGTGMELSQDGFFDTAIVGDMGGQVWTLRMFAPAELTVAPSTTGSNVASARLASNWFVARTFEQTSTQTGPVNDNDESSANGTSIASINPIFQIAGNAWHSESGSLRTLIGTGDRFNISDQRAGDCRVDNPMGCAKYSCEYKSEFTVEHSSKKHLRHLHFKGGAIKHLSRTVTASAQTNACTFVSARQVDTLSCAGGINPGAIKDLTTTCSGSPTLTCTRPTVAFNPNNFSNNGFTDTGLAKNRFYAFWGYGGSRRFATDSEATTFDSNRLRDANLTDATAFTSSSAGASVTGNGWWVEYGELPERTASGSAVIASCVMWNTLQTQLSPNQCALAQTHTSRLYQGDLVTGLPNCAASLSGARYVARSSISPPPEPSLSVSVSKSGKIRYQVQSFEPAQGQAVSEDLETEPDAVQLIYSVEVPEKMHACRHAGQSCP